MIKDKFKRREKLLLFWQTFNINQGSVKGLLACRRILEFRDFKAVFEASLMLKDDKDKPVHKLLVLYVSLFPPNES